MKVSSPSNSERAVTAVCRAAELAWNELQQSPFLRAQFGQMLDARLPEISLQATQARSALAGEITALLEGVNETLLPHDAALTARLLRHYAGAWSREADHYWLAHDAFGPGFYGPFSMTAYTGGFVLTSLANAIAKIHFETLGDVDRYLALLADLGRMLRQMHDRTAGQAERGIRIPRPQIPACRALIVGLKAMLGAALRVGPVRLSKIPDAPALASAIDRRLDQVVLPELDTLAIQLDAAYEAAAPAGVGMDQLPGGREVYIELVRLHCTMDLTPEEIHRRGHARMGRIESEMAEVRARIGFSGTAAEFHTHLRSNPRAVAKDADDISARMRRHKDCIEARFDEFFAERAPAAFDVARMPSAMEGGMTWGYYQPPGPTEPRGIYHYNGSKLDSQAVIGAASLVFHELVPGHHLHLNTQWNNFDLHPVRRYALINAYNEGWAEYAATVTGEMGLYDDPYDRYGRLLMDAFLSSRLVVDTGMNVLGWTWEQAKQYLREHTLCSEAEVASDTLRYSCGIPAQALAYKLGDEEILGMRQACRERQGSAFDIRAFHSAVLGPGALPLPALRWHLESVFPQTMAQ